MTNTPMILKWQKAKVVFFNVLFGAGLTVSLLAGVILCANGLAEFAFSGFLNKSQVAMVLQFAALPFIPSLIFGYLAYLSVQKEGKMKALLATS